jgi:hypothetical protein
MPNPDWMGALRNNVQLSQITMPASHDAGISTPTYANKGANLQPSVAICQSLDIAGQLNAGSRFFDLRFARHKTPVVTARTYHTTAGSGGWGENAVSIFTAVDTFLAQHAGEVVILRITQTGANTMALVQQAQAAHLGAARTYTPAAANTVVAQETLQNLRGRAVVAYEGLAQNDPANRWTRFAKVGGGNNAGVVTCGKYPNASTITPVNGNALKRVVRHTANCRAHTPAATASNHLSMAYWQLTGGNIQNNTLAGFVVGAGGPFNAAHGTHYNLPFLLAWLKGQRTGGQETYKGANYAYPAADNLRCNWVPNIINLDFVNDAVCNAIITFNRDNLTAAGLHP